MARVCARVSEKSETRFSIVVSMTRLRLLAFGAHADLYCLLGLGHFAKVVKGEMAMKYSEAPQI